MNDASGPATVLDASYPTATIAPRPVHFDWPADLPQYWFGGDAFRTHYMNALSILFPVGEQFFIDAVRELRDANDDPVLERAIRGFIGQEGWHCQAHLGFNTYLEGRGLPVAALEARVARRIVFAQEHLTPIRRLAATVCLEHFTAIMAHHLLRREDHLTRMPDHFRRLWIWHALEELEHKAVAFDLYVKAGGTFGMRVRVMLLVTINFSLDIAHNMFGLLRADRRLWDLGVWLEGARFLFGPKHGLLRSLLPDYLRFFRRAFHPWEADDRALIQSAAQLAALTPEAS